LTGFVFGPLYAIWSPQPGVILSEGAQYPTDQSALWRFPITWTGISTDMSISVARAESGGVFYARWEMQIFNGSALLFRAFYWGVYAPPRVFPSNFEFSVIDSPGPVSIDAIFQFEEATYAEGGSPW